ncbi:hypothetical protein ACFOY4_10620 [Actinomadura syzygii]|uniref:Uncharacterized protein n=1 Tax=Actinomadura syzygii TaxID=1427538 RepID=A0A5D0UBK1_9ACTN|nr:hypothetical protein [Actinomadura syzygii]TYC15748.1 hypothetical protein FXF65_10350 [Actinomadura syzygii]
MDADTAHALMALLAERRMERGAAPAAEPFRVEGTHVPPSGTSSPPPPTAQAVPAAQGPVVTAVSPFGQPTYAEPGYVEPGYADPGYAESAAYAEPAYGQPAYGQPAYAEPGYAQAPYAEAPFVQPQQGGQIFPGGTGPTPLLPSVYPTH